MPLTQHPPVYPPRAVAIIPARAASTRFPGKVLADRTGMPLVQHVVEAAKRARTIERIAVATDDPRVADALAPYGTTVVMTSPDHPNGTSRLAEAATLLDLEPESLVANVQGDEPEIDPDVIDAAVEALAHSHATVSTVASPFATDQDPRNPNLVKVVRAIDGSAMYFSRARIPFDRDGLGGGGGGGGGDDAAPLRHIGLYVYRRSFLEIYIDLPSTPAERSESLEQLRILQHGYKIAVAVRESSHQGIDTPDQYEAFVQRWNNAHPTPVRG